MASPPIHLMIVVSNTSTLIFVPDPRLRLLVDVVFKYYDWEIKEGAEEMWGLPMLTVMTRSSSREQIDATLAELPFLRRELQTESHTYYKYQKFITDETVPMTIFPPPSLD